MVEARRHYGKNIKKYQLSDGSWRSYASHNFRYYYVRLHHPDEEEIAQIRQELAAGCSKISVARAHHLGNDTRRLNRFLNNPSLLSPKTLRIPRVIAMPPAVPQKIAKHNVIITDADIAAILDSFD